MKIDIRSDAKELAKRIKTAHRKHIPAATNRALNKVGDRAYRDSARKIAKQLGVSQKTIADKKATSTNRGSHGLIIRQRSKFKMMRYLITFARKGISLAHLNPQQTTEGVVAGEKGKRELRRSAFIATVRGEHRAVFRRKTKARLPIQKLYGPSLSTVGEQTNVQQEAEATFRKDFAPEFMKDIRGRILRERAKARRTPRA